MKLVVPKKINNYAHTPVLLTTSITFLQIKPDGVYVDCTLGRAGHSAAILAQLTSGKLYAFDQDEEAITTSSEKLKPYYDKIHLINSNFANLTQELAKLNVTAVDGILYDLGVSSPQINNNRRGFSYMQDAALDMRMNQKQKLCAHQVVNTYSYDSLKTIIKTYGEERFAHKIAANIVNNRIIKPINTTLELVTIIKASLPEKALKKQHHHPAKKTFQALRIFVNDELLALKSSLEQALTLLKPQGRLVVISFHSLEDRIVKTTFKKAITDPQKLIFDKLPIASQWQAQYKIITKKPLLPSKTEITNNPRAKSAKLRVLAKI